MASEINVLSANIFDIGQACEYVQRLEVDRPFREKEGERAAWYEGEKIDCLICFVLLSSNIYKETRWTSGIEWVIILKDNRNQTMNNFIAS